jgi:glycerophosphoryl diester phosphodiesterase
VLIYGHRGASATEPENTLRAFERAIEAGADGLEFDVQVSADGVPVLIHDREVSRTTNGRGNIDELSLAEIKRLDAGGGERVPTFAEALDAIGVRAHLDIEVKQGGIEREILAVLAEHPQTRWTISCFDWDVLRKIRGLDANADLWLLSYNVAAAVLDTAKQIGASGVALDREGFNQESAKQLRDAGLKTVIWTVNDVEEAIRCRKLGASGICTDEPVAMISSLR